MNRADEQYLCTLGRLLREGVRRDGRNGGTFGLFGEQLRFDLREGFPLLTSKRVNFDAIKVELLWFLRGDTNIKFLHDNGVHIWDEWADENGDLGPVYGSQWRNWPDYDGDGSGFYERRSIDQIRNVIKSLKDDPHGRRHIVTAWNPAEIGDMALPPCHCLFQFHVANGVLNCQLYQRSADWFLGVPFNIASYALLTILMAREVDLMPGELIHTFGDYHLYQNHIDQAWEQLRRDDGDLPALPVLSITTDVSIFDLSPDDIGVIDYRPLAAIKAPISK